MLNKTYEIINYLKTEDFELLKNIYLLRCLSLKQAFNFFYKKTNLSYEEFNNTYVKLLLNYEVIELQQFKNENTAIFLTSVGIEIVRYYFDLPSEIFDSSKRIIKRGYYRAGELKLLPKQINHQIHLNQFVLEFKKYASLINLNYSYFDEKYVSKYVNIRPDGLISLLDVDFFLEQDMSTENRNQLVDKWNNYRQFLKTREYNYNENKIIVFFIIDGTNNIESRKNIVRFSISNILLDILNDKFDIYIGTRKELLDIMFNTIIPNLNQSNSFEENFKKLLFEKHNLSTSNGEVFNKYLFNSNYAYFIREINNNNHIIIKNGRIQEFLLDSYTNRPLSVLNKIAYHNRNSSYFKQYFNRDIDYVILVDDISTFYNDLKISDLIGIKHIYVTTLERLKKYPLYKALLQIDSLGSVYSHSDYSLNNLIYEDNLEGN